MWNWLRRKFSGQFRAAEEVNTWSHPPQLVRFAEFLARARTSPELFSDDEFVEQVNLAYWPTNCWSFVEQSFAIISAVCAIRPHLAERLIEEPIRAMIYGGLESEDDVIAQGTAIAHKPRAYVPLSDDGRAWLIEQWPGLKNEAKAIFRRIWAETTPSDNEDTTEQ